MTRWALEAECGPFDPRYPDAFAAVTVAHRALIELGVAVTLTQHDCRRDESAGRPPDPHADPAYGVALDG